MYVSTWYSLKHVLQKGIKNGVCYWIQTRDLLKVLQYLAFPMNVCCTDAQFINSAILDLRTYPPLDCFLVIVYEIILLKSTITTQSISDKKLNVPRGNLSNYFMRIIVFSLLYCLKSATLEIAYNMKIDSFVMYSITSSQTTECENNLYVRSNKF